MEMYCARGSSPSHNTCIKNLQLRDLWSLPSWYLGLSVKKIRYMYLAAKFVNMSHLTT